MCVSRDADALAFESKFRKENAGQTITAFKVVLKMGASFYAPFKNFKYHPNWNDGIIPFNGDWSIPDDYVYDDDKPAGIHVFLDRKTAEFLCNNMAIIHPQSTFFTIIEVKCHLDNLLAADGSEASFRKVWIDPKYFTERD